MKVQATKTKICSNFGCLFETLNDHYCAKTKACIYFIDIKAYKLKTCI